MKKLNNILFLQNFRTRFIFGAVTKNFEKKNIDKKRGN